MKKLFLLVTAFALSLGSACAQNAKFETLMPTQKVLQFKDNATSPRKAPGRKVELAEGQQVFGAYTSDNLASDGLGLPRYPGNYQVATQIPAEIISMYDGCQIVKMRFGLCVANEVSRVFIYPVDAEGNIGAAIVDEATKGGKAGWNEVTISQPVTISKENVSGYLMGYDYVQSNKNDGQYYDNECFPLSLVNEGAYTCPTYVYGNLGQGTGWNNIGAEDYGNLSVQAVVEGEFPENGLMPLAFDEVTMMLGETGTVNLSLMNLGSEPLNNFSYTMTIDGVPGEEQTYTLDNPVTSFGAMIIANIPVEAAETARESQVVIDITKVNGQENSASQTSVQGIVTTLSELIERNILVEEFTGTACGWCPRGLAGMELMRETFGSRFVGVGLHWYNTSDAMYFDPAYYAPVDFGGAPSCRINRGAEMDPKYGTGNDICDDVRAAMNQPSKGSVEVAADWNDDQTQVIATATVSPAIDTENLEVAFVLVADQLSGTGSAWNQSNYYYQYTAAQVGDPDLDQFCKGGTYGKSTITGWKFNDVAIASSYENYTNLAPAVGFVKAGETGEVTFTLDMPTKATLKKAINTDQVYIVAILTSASGSVENAAKAKVGGDDPTSIATLDTDATETVSYNLNGVQLAAPQQGVNIVRMANGQVKKVVVK